jgi:hypothetical protein
MSLSLDTVPHTPADKNPLGPFVNPFLFIIGCPRSGTTMLKRMLNAHPEIAITRETHWIPRVFDRGKGLTADGRVTNQLPERLFRQRRFEQMKFGPPALESLIAAHPSMTYAELVSRIFDHFGERKGKRFVGDKTPTYARKVPTLDRLWPRAKFLHIVRDGRDVWLSMQNWRMADRAAGQFSTWASDPVITTALWWNVLVGLGHEDGTALPSGRYLSLKYESLVTDPTTQCHAIADFLQVYFDERMTKYYEGQTQTTPGLSANCAWLPPTPGLRNWRTQMPTSDVETFEAAAGGLLDRLGYDRWFIHPSPCVRQRVLRVKEQFTRELIDRGWRLPASW